MADAALQVKDLRVDYETRRGGRRTIHAVRGVTFSLERGASLGLVGESGCGKTSLARALVGLEPSTGEIILGDVTLDHHRTKEQARRIQMVFQDPYASLNPRMSVADAVEEMLRVHGLRSRSTAASRVEELADLVGLPRRTLPSRPGGLSGGQRQRVAIARALALEPDVLVADEPTTALDVSVQALILRLIADLRMELGLGLLLITHNIAVVSALCDRIAVMYLGKIVEEGPTRSVLENPRHPYTRRLFTAVPRLDRPTEQRSPLAGDPPDPASIPAGCPFHPRCPEATAYCAAADPELKEGSQPGDTGHVAACHYAWEASVLSGRA